MRNREATASRAGVVALSLLGLAVSAGCARLYTGPVVGPMAGALESQRDIEVVREGLPAMVLALDGMIARDPAHRRLLLEAAKANILFATLLRDEGEEGRALISAAKAKEYGARLLVLSSPVGEGDLRGDLDSLKAKLRLVEAPAAPALFWAAQGWGAWIECREGAPAAMADLPRVVAMMQRAAELDGGYNFGGPHLFLGVYHSSFPPALGGRPEEGRSHFEEALRLAGRQYLLTQVYYAETYARMTMDRTLFLSLLDEVLAAAVDRRDVATANAYAARRAAKLMTRVDELFPE